MADVTWTPEQQQAIETRGRDLLVSAGAGAGKTAVLVERVLRMITDPVRPVDVNRILVVTFTNAAAEEMRIRVGGALQKALRSDPGSPLLNRQTALLEQASITTMHSFCLDTLRRYFELIDLDPAFRVGDEHELSLLRVDVLTALFESQYGVPASADRFSRLVDIYGGERGDLALQELVLRLYDFVRSMPRPRQWLAKALAMWDPDDTKAPDYFFRVPDLYRILDMEFGHAHALLGRAMDIARMPEGPQAYLPVLQPEFEAAARLMRAVRTNPAELAREFEDLAFKRLPAARGGDKALRERAKQLRTEARKILGRLTDTYFSRSPDEWGRDMRTVYPVLGDLADLTIAFGEAYIAAKRDRGLVDFADLEHLCLRILSAEEEDHLVPSAAAEELRDWYQEIMVDEYQDINGIQEAVLNLISRADGPGANRFLVGDVKQSIYRFRLAAPDLFLQKYRSYPLLSAARGGAARIDLSRNFRSRRAIIGAVNDIFGRIMCAETGEIDYDERARLNYGAEYPPVPEPHASGGDKVELHVLNRAAPSSAAAVTNESTKDTDGDHEAAEMEARLTASRIKRLVGGLADQDSGPIYDRGQRRYRALAYRDIVVLLRSPKGWAHKFVEVFHQEGIPVFADLGSGYFAAAEVEAMLSLLTVIDNPRQDIPLAGVLRSPWNRFDARDLADIRAGETEEDFFTCVQRAAQKEGRLAQRLQVFLEQLDQWRTFARRKPLPELIWQLYRDTGYYEFVGGLPGGAQRQANLRALHHRARRYERTSYRGLFRFLRFIERVREQGDDLGTARPLGEKEDVVRVMSVHRSKGLEFPVVILAGLGKQFNFRDCYGEVLLHKDLGLAVDVVDPELRLRYPTLPKHLVRDRLQEEARAEEMRVLYVALTRARERLILIGSGDADKLLDTPSYADSPVLGRWRIRGGRSFLEWITFALARVMPPSKPSSTPWLINVVNASAVAGDISAATPRPVIAAPAAPAESVTNEIQRRLEWRYPRLPETVRPIKRTATELRKAGTQADDAAPLGPYRPRLIRQPRCLDGTAPLSAVEYGTAVHLVMQHIDWNAAGPEEVRRELDRMADAEIITAGQAGAVDDRLIARFLQSALACRIRAGVTFRREVPFTVRLPAAQFYPDVQPDEYVLVQGVIDGLLTEDDGFVIIDYKTDRVPPGKARAVGERYRSQLDVYAAALASITGKRIKAKYIYLFDAETVIEV